MTRLVAAVVLALAGALALACIGGGSDDAEPTATATTTTQATATATPTPSPTGPPGPAAGATPTTTATPTPTPTRVAESIDGDPFSLDDFESALPSPGLALSDEFEAACPGASAQPVVFAGPDGGSSERHAVWVLWVYADRDAFQAEWSVGEDFRVSPLLDGCAPPNGFVYWHENLLLWFAGFYGSEVAPGSLPATAAEVREHPVVRTFLGLTWQ
ncbi:MAG: hypothetical protein F4X26_07165 [Chloroflexi bacterium]|nr:hypothetical protein [Chloroflexota bacterium]